MKGKEQLRLAVQELLLGGYSYDVISQRLGISVSTVGRIIKKIRQSSEHWLENLAQQDLAHIYREGVEGLRHDLMRLNDLAENPSIKDNPEFQLQIIKQITIVRTEYLKQLRSAPILWSMNALVKNHTVPPIEQPTLKSLGGITGVL